MIKPGSRRAKGAPKMRDLEEVKAEVAEIEEKHNKIIAAYMEKREAAKEREAAALEEAEKAYKKAKVEDYHKAQEEARTNHDAIQMYAAKVEELKREPVITKAKFDELREDIAEYLGVIVAEDKENLRDLVSEMVEIKDREGHFLTEGNALIEHLQKDLLKDPCGLFAKNGDFIPQPHMIKKFKDYSVSEFLNFVTQHPLVNDLVEHGEFTYWGRK